MSAGLLISRQTKNSLLKIQLVNKTIENVTKYKNYKQIYFKTIRAAKKLYFRNKLQANVNNQKKTWDTLNEALGKEKSSTTIDKINIDGQTSTDLNSIANHFNSFFTSIGSDIFNSIAPVRKQPEDYVYFIINFPISI
jgi:tRNA/tmRNA/rRNA uracil-C5-methylase (TrmA/RlmC/RlmD family)